MSFYRSIVILIALTVWCGGCAALTGVKSEYLVCPYDTVWDAALETMRERPVTVQDKGKGVIETAWIDTPVTGRPYGIFSRQGLDNKERARMVLMVKRVNEVTEVSLSENRERWHLRGGATSQAYRWWPIEPSQEVINSVLNRLRTKLKERGCSPT